MVTGEQMTGLSVMKYSSLITRINIKGVGEVAVRKLILRCHHINIVCVVDHLIRSVHPLEDNGTIVGMKTRVVGATVVIIHPRLPAVVHIVMTVMITVVTGIGCHMMNSLRYMEISAVTEETAEGVGRITCMMMEEEQRAGIVIRNTCTSQQIEKSSTKVVNNHFQIVNITLDKRNIMSHLLDKKELNIWIIEVIVAHHWKGLISMMIMMMS